MQTVCQKIHKNCLQNCNKKAACYVALAKHVLAVTLFIIYLCYSSAPPSPEQSCSRGLYNFPHAVFNEQHTQHTCVFLQIGALWTLERYFSDRLRVDRRKEKVCSRSPIFNVWLFAPEGWVMLAVPKVLVGSSNGHGAWRAESQGTSEHFSN